MIKHSFVSRAALLLSLAVPGTAMASTGVDSPDSGALQVGRGSAWVARADDPLAAYFNPAALAWQATGVHLGAHLIFIDRCFTRLGPDLDGDGKGDPVSPGNSLPGPGAEGGPPAEVCADAPLFPNPQIAATFRILDNLAIGVAVVAPHGVGNVEWPETLEYQAAFGPAEQPYPGRYMLQKSNSILLNPTLSVAYAPTAEAQPAPSRARNARSAVSAASVGSCASGLTRSRSSASSARISTASAPCPGDGSISSAESHSVTRPWSPRRSNPAPASTMAS